MQSSHCRAYSLIGNIGCRHFSSYEHTMNIVRSGIMSLPVFDNICGHPSNRSAMEKLKYCGIGIKEETMLNSSKEGIISDDTTYFVGDFNQYPSSAHENIAKFTRDKMVTLQPISEWRCDKTVQQQLGIPVTSTIDYHPFPITFPSKKLGLDQKNKKRKKSSASSKWNVSDINNYKDLCMLRDSHGQNMPFLTRPLGKTSNQQLLIWRDVHPDIKTIPKIEKVIEIFEPNMIVLEYPSEGQGLDIYPSLQRKIISPMTRLRQNIVTQSRSTVVGTKWYWKNKFWNLNVTDSFAIDRAIEIAIRNKIAISLSDYPSSTKYLLMAGAEALDLYPSTLWKLLEFPLKQCCNLLESQSKLSLDFLHSVVIKLIPHVAVSASYRNDMMALTINECIQDRILYIGGGLHAQDIIHRLCGKVEIRNPFKAISERTVELKRMVPLHYSGYSQIEWNDNDVLIATEKLGKKAVKQLTMNNQELNMELVKLIVKNLRMKSKELCEEDIDVLLECLNDDSEWKQELLKEKQKWQTK